MKVRKETIITFCTLNILFTFQSFFVGLHEYVGISLRFRIVMHRTKSPTLEAFVDKTSLHISVNVMEVAVMQKYLR
eukprot:UN00004